MGRKELLLALALLFLLGVGATAARLLEARRTGLSLRLQVFIPLAATTLLLSAMFAGIVIDRFTARASLFATRAAEDEARAIAELAGRRRPSREGAKCARARARWSRCGGSWKSATRWRTSSPTCRTS